jgi:adenylate cyclase
VIDPGRWTRPRWILAAAGLSWLLGAILVWLPAGPLPDWEAAARDLVWRSLPARPGSADAELLIVDIDQRSVNAWGSHSSWLQQQRLPELLDWLAAAEARTVVLDILLDPKSPDADQRLLKAVSDNGRVIPGFQFAHADAASFLHPMQAPPAPLADDPGLPVGGTPFVWQPERMECGLPAVLAAAAGYGFVNNDPDRGGVFRSALLMARFGERHYPSLALAGALHHLGWTSVHFEWMGAGELRITADQGSRTLPLDRGRMEVRFRSGRDAYQRVSILDILTGKLDPAYARDRLVLVGSSLPGLDLKPVPLSDSYPGVEIQATVISNLLGGDPLVSLPRSAVLVLIALVAGLSALCFALRRLWIGLPGLGLLVALVWALARIGLDHGWPVGPLILPSTVAVLAGLLMGLWRLQGEMRDRHFISNAFSLYVSREVLGELLDHPERLRLGGERSSLSLLFADIRSFTRLSEGLQPADLGALLNRYLTAMSRVILAHGGTVDKYIGDEVVAIFGAPLPLPDQEAAACRAAVEMQRRLAQLRVELADTPFADLAIGVGVHTGLVMVGNFGSEMRFSYTAIGDAMNLASRLEGLTKEYGVGILVSGTTLERAGAEFRSRRLDRVRVLGKSEPVEIHALYLPEEAPDPQCEAAYTSAWKDYAAGRFAEAAAAFARCVELWPKDGPCRALAARCRILQAGNRPGWDGVWQMDRK